MRKSMLIVALGALGMSGFAGIAVDGRLPAGNVVVEKIEGDQVSLHQDLRDSSRDWFYWKFRVTGAAGRTLKFRFTKSAAVGSRGPAVSTDRGKTWTWGDDLQPSPRREAQTNDHADWKGFDWKFGPEDDEVWFSQAIPYDASDWRAFLDRHAADRGRLFEEGVLCKSRKGRDVEYARFGRLDGKAKYRIFAASRHHCEEISATYVLDGMLEQVFADDDLGRWMRENVEIRVVPFADKDGAVDGDQGKYRKPHDHARDYNEDRPVLYPEVRSIMKMLREWNPTVVNDYHSPWLRGNWFQKNNANEYVYQVGFADPACWARQQAFGKAVERVQTGGMGYRQADDFAPGQGWNTASNYSQGKTLTQWAMGVFTNAALVSSWEIPFANSRYRTLYPKDWRAFGRDVAAGYREHLESFGGPESIDGVYPTSVGPRKAVVIECESFEDFGGWKNDSQFMDQMGSPYLLAHGLGCPVKDAKTSFCAESGRYSVWARTKNWTAPWKGGGEGAGRFDIFVNGQRLSQTLGVQGDGEWLWVNAGEVDLTNGTNVVALRDLTGFDGRCDALVFVLASEPIPDFDQLRAVGQGEVLPTRKEYDLVVVGGGIAGICAAVTASRLGLSTALVHDRPVLGGNNSSEVRVHLGAYQNLPPFPRLGDVLAEFAPVRGGNARPAANYEDARKLEIVRAEPNLDLYLEEHVNGVDVVNGTISGVRSVHVRTGVRRHFRARLFADCTGDGTVGFLAGAEFRQGRESRGEHGESLAPETADQMTMGASVQWYAITNRASAFPQKS